MAGHRVKESNSERLLGVIVNNNMTWQNHIYGDPQYAGLLAKLEQRSAMIKKLSSVMPAPRLKQIAQGIFFSLLDYCIEVYGNTWGLDTLDANSRHSSAFRQEDCKRIQVVVNKVLRILLNMDKDTPTAILCASAGQLSVHQRVAFSTLCSVFKIINTGKPKYSYELLKNQTAKFIMYNQYNCRRVDCKLSISWDSFIYRGSRLFNMIPASLAQSPNMKIFKKEAKSWVLKSIPLQP